MLDNTRVMRRASSVEATAQDELLAELLDDYLSALQRGTPLDIVQLAAEHPQLAHELRSFAEGVDLLHQITTKCQVAQTHGSGVQAGNRLGDFELGQELGNDYAQMGNVGFTSN